MSDGIEKYLAMEWLDSTKPVACGSKIFATKEACIAFIKKQPRFPQFPDVNWTIVTVYDTSPAEEKLQAEVERLKSKLYAVEFAVGDKYPNETRYETALRYITEHQAQINQPAPAEQEDSDESNPETTSTGME